MKLRTPEIMFVAAMKEEIRHNIENQTPYLFSDNGKFKQYWEPDQFEGQIAFMCCGVGRKRAKKSIKQILDYVLPDRIIIAGFAGAINPEVQVGDLLLTRDVYYAENDTNTFFNFDTDLTAFFSKTLKKETISHHIGTGVCCDKMVDNAEYKQALRKKYKADCVDMESYHIQKILQDKNIPIAMIRVISDKADESLGVDFSKIPKGKWATRKYFLAHPKEYRALRKLSKTAMATTNILNRANQVMISSISNYLRR